MWGRHDFGVRVGDSGRGQIVQGRSRASCESKKCRKRVDLIWNGYGSVLMGDAQFMVITGAALHPNKLDEGSCFGATVSLRRPGGRAWDM